MHHKEEDLGLVLPSISLRVFGFKHISM